MVELLSPATLLDLRTLAGTGRIIAGGTDLIVQMRSGRNETHLIDITNIEDAPCRHHPVGRGGALGNGFDHQGC